MPSIAEFTAKAQTLTVDELITLGRQLNAIDAPQILFDELAGLIFDRDGEAEAERWSDATFA